MIRKNLINNRLNNSVQKIIVGNKTINLHLHNGVTIIRTNATEYGSSVLVNGMSTSPINPANHFMFIRMGDFVSYYYLGMDSIESGNNTTADIKLSQSDTSTPTTITIVRM